MAGQQFLITGAGGQLGRALRAACGARGLAAVGVGTTSMPLHDRAAIRATLERERPAWVLHCGAVTNVDGCETDPLGAYRINGLGTAWLAEAAAAVGAGLVYMSTDFVFDGSATTPYAVDAPVRPLSVYGASKRLGEEAVLGHGRADFHVVRTSWVFGPGGKNFPRAILDRARSGQPLKVVTDQIGCPTYAPDLADALLDLVASRAPGGIWHAANDGQCSWHGFASAVLQAAGLGAIALGTQTAAELKRPAPRPAWSVLDTGKLAAVRGRPLPPHTDAIRRWLVADAATAQAGGGKNY
ncbi:MAG: dTDP-4-dehydrorhamnose reductase [Planctomycetes bacterium]|nr:dTDP-4-dehydrorhamnose reductase [Planctomycetota bacterium]